MKKILLCDDGEILKVLPIAQKNKLGIEMQAFYNPLEYEKDNSLVLDHLSHIQNISLRAVHGCFGDLCPGSFDPLVRDVAKKRFELSYSAATQLNAEHLIFHHGYVPHTSPPERWIIRCTAFWKEFMCGKGNSIKIYIENVLEWDPKLLSDLIDAIGNQKVTANLDIGHAHCNSKTSVLEWIKTLNKRIGYTHLHDNNGKEDEHLTLGKGTIPLKEVLSALEYYSPDAYWAIESDINEMEQSLEWLDQSGVKI
jgi:sugar phosphate isomerase/epimerase